MTRPAARFPAAVRARDGDDFFSLPQSAADTLGKHVVVHLEADPEEQPLASETIEAWRAGHAQADVTVKLEDDVPADDIVLDVVNALLDFITANPAKSDEWKRKADEALEKGE